MLKVKQQKFVHKITKRSCKTFTTEKWNKCLEQADWAEIDKQNSASKKAEVFTKIVTECLDKVAPIKTFTVKSNYRFGLSEKVKDLMSKRDITRKQICQASNSEKAVLMKKYKSLRNAVTNLIRKENIEHNNNRVEEAKNEAELWKIANEVNNPKSQPNWRLDINGKKIESEEEIAECFNDYFVDKIQKLKENIDPEYIGDPLAKLKKKHENNVCKFALKQVSPNKLTKILKKLKKKKEFRQ